MHFRAFQRFSSHFAAKLILAALLLVGAGQLQTGVAEAATNVSCNSSTIYLSEGETKQYAVNLDTKTCVETITLPANGLAISFTGDLPTNLSVTPFSTTQTTAGGKVSKQCLTSCTETLKFFNDTVTVSINYGFNDGLFQSIVNNVSVSIADPVAAPALSSFTRSGTIAYNTGTASATSIDVATLGSATNSPTAYYIGQGGTETSGSSFGGGTVSITTAGVASYKPRVGWRGTDTFQVRAANAGGTSDAATVTVTVGDPTLSIDLQGTGARINTALSGYKLNVTGGNAPYSCTVKTGSLPAGVSFGSNCALEGSPTESGTFTFTAEVVDSSLGIEASNFTATSGSLSLTVAKAAQATVTASVDASTIKFGNNAFLSSSGGSGTGDVSFKVASGPCSIGITTVSGVMLNTTGVGSCSVTATKAGDTNYEPATSNPITVTVQKADQATLTVAVDKTEIPYFDYAVLSTTGGSGDGQVFYNVVSGSKCVVAVVQAEESPVLLAVGVGVNSCKVTATKAASSNYNEATSEVLTLTTVKAEQETLTASADPMTIKFGETSQLSYDGGSGDGEVTYSVADGDPCEVDGSELHTTGAGTCSVTATSAADDNFNEISSDPITVTVEKADQDTLTALVSPDSITFGESSQLSFTGGSGDGEVSIDVTGPCEFNAETYEIASTGAGTCMVTVNKAGDDNYLATSSDTVSISVAKATQATLMASASPSTIKFGETSTLSTTGGNGTGLVTYEVISGPCEVTDASTDAGIQGASGTGTTLHTTGAGTCSIKATKAADDDYLVVSSAPITVTVDKANQDTLMASASPSTIKFGETSTLSSTGGSGTGWVTYQVVSGPCTVDGIELSTTGAGTCSVKATKAADNDYLEKSSEPIDVTVEMAEQDTLTASANPSTIKFGETSTLSSMGGNGTGGVTYQVVSGPCTVDGTELSTTGAGTCSVTATKAADDDYLEAISEPITVTVEKANQDTLTASASPSTIKFGEKSTLSSMGGSGDGEVTFSVAEGDPCTISGTELSTTAAGSCSVTARKAASANHLAATSTAITVTVGKATPSSLTVTASPASIKVKETSSLSHAGNIGTGAVSYEVAGPCSLSGNTVTASAIGTCKVTATQAADSNYEKQTATANIAIGNTDPVTTEPDVPQVVEAQVKSSATIIEAQFNNVIQRLDVLQGGGRESFSFGLNLANGDEGPAWSLPGKQEQAARRAAFGHAADINVENRETALGVSKSAETVVSSSESPISGWINGNVTYGKQDNGSETGISRDRFTTGGVTLGADMRVSDSLIAGAAVGYGETGLNIGSHGSKSDSRFGSALVYGTLALENGGFVDMVAGYGFGRFDLARWSTLGSTLLKGERDATQLFGSLRYSRPFELEGDLRITPSARLEVLQTSLAAYSETGAAASALSYDSLSLESVSGVAGFKLEKVQKLPWGVLLPSLRAEYRQAFDGSYRQSLAYVNTPSISYGLEGDSGSKGTALLGLGLTAVNRDGWSLDMGYDFAADVSGKDNLISHSLQATFRTQF